MKITDFKAISFDCYGTLIDWESGFLKAYRPVLARSPKKLSEEEILQTHARLEALQEAETPKAHYSELLAQVHRKAAAEWGVTSTESENQSFGKSVPEWPAFPDSAEALQYLGKHFKLVILSNIDHESFRRSNERLRVEFDYIFTAQDIGSYKPSQKNFDYLIARMEAVGIKKHEILHTAESLFHDHAPANIAGLSSARICRRHGMEGSGATPLPKVMPKYDFSFLTLEEMAQAHRDAVKGS